MIETERGQKTPRGGCRGSTNDADGLVVNCAANRRRFALFHQKSLEMRAASVLAAIVAVANGAHIIKDKGARKVPELNLLLKMTRRPMLAPGTCFTWNEITIPRQGNHF
jgi:hypothetical protein